MKVVRQLTPEFGLRHYGKNASGAAGVYFYSGAWGETGHYREYGRNIRAVRNK